MMAMVMVMVLMVATYIADSPSNGALLTRGAGLVCLALDTCEGEKGRRWLASHKLEEWARRAFARGSLTKIHDVVAADGAVVDYYVPGPESDCVPLELDMAV